jgi:ABC-type nitrate/sulfonate/bicarbonate transport system substrate-binding protein
MRGMEMANVLTRRQFISRGAAASALAVGGGSLFLASCGDDEGSTPQQITPANFQLSWVKDVQFAGTYIADDRGYHADQGLKVSILPGGPDVTTVGPVLSAQALAGIDGALPLAQARQEGAPVKIIGTVNQNSPFVIISLANAPVAEPQDLVGKRVGVATANETYFTAFLKLTQVDPSSLTKVPVQYDPAPLVAGEVDAWMGYLTDEYLRLVEQGVDVHSFSLSDYGVQLYVGTYFATEDSIKERDEITRFMRAEVKGWQDNVADPELGARLTVEKYGKDLGNSFETQLEANHLYIDETIVTPETETRGLLYMTEEGIAKNVEFLDSVGVSADGLFDNSILESIFEGKSSI